MAIPIRQRTHRVDQRNNTTDFYISHNGEFDARHVLGERGIEGRNDKSQLKTLFVM